MGIKLKQHNEEAYEKVRKMFMEGNTAAVVHPTGTGKTYIALRFIEQSKGKVVYISPSKHILNQVKEDIEKAKLDGELTDEEYARYQEIKYMTYSELMEQSKIEKGYDQIILDEFHRCGAPEWGKGVQRLLEENTNAQILGLTATPVRAVDHKDMAKELFKDRVASEMTLEEVVANGIINTPIYINALYSIQDTIKKTEKQIEQVQSKEKRKELRKQLEELKGQLESAEGIEDIFAQYASKKDGKYIVFCSDIKDMHKKMREAKKWFSKVGETSLYEISYKRSNEANQEEIDKFKEKGDKVNLLFTVDKLNEGIHIEGLDGVIMLRKTESPIVYMQQLGRALSVGNEGTPIVFDFVNNIESSQYIYQFMERVHNIQERNRDNKKENVNIKIIEVQRKIKEILKQITQKLDRKTIDEKIESLIQLGNIDGIHQKDITDQGETIGIWKWQIKKAYREGRLSKKQIKLLEENGMNWNEREEDVDLRSKVEALLNHGNISEIRVRDKTEDGRRVGQWKKDVKKAYKEGRLTPEEISMLEEEGIEWDEKGKDFSLADKVDFLEKHGDIGSIKQSDISADGIKIGQMKWQLRKLYKAGKLTEEQIERLEKQGMRWQDRKSLSGLRKKKQEVEEKLVQAEELLRQYEQQETRENEG